MYSLEGLIGSGKSEVLKELETRGFSVKLESVDAWTLLGQFYEDADKNAFALQVQILSSYAHKDYEKSQIIERSPSTALGIFAASLNMSVTERVLLQYLARILPLPSAPKFIYLDAPVDVCLRRIKSRGRSAESKMTIEYLVSLKAAHEEFFKNYDVCRVGLTGNESVQQVADLIQAILLKN